MKTTPRYTTTERLVEMCKDSEGRNRGPNQRFYDDVDPAGVHVCCLYMPHNGPSEVRSMWLCKMKDMVQPVELWVDCSKNVFDRNAFTMRQFDKCYPHIIPSSLLQALDAPAAT